MTPEMATTLPSSETGSWKTNVQHLVDYSVPLVEPDINPILTAGALSVLVAAKHVNFAYASLLVKDGQPTRIIGQVAAFYEPDAEAQVLEVHGLEPAV